MKKLYRMTITGDRFPTEYTVQASNWGTAVARGIREWQQRFKGSRTKKLSIRVFKSGPLLTDDNGEKKYD